mmetsp:Transcript_18452/g.35948  ORF Transcript_18452/g.35948 Transcript_18452/m.35948 type:complete len:412 (-) Transcript_18452:314-1549(-)|eukprot:CAMPEP_0173381090 /NCGR_PEP_ID=MMETSP1356-20130122/3572_1 /TAXON_ID=77927 ORGANISM="Hemiselmis virescens, Strain PCC157" /NCGR_SAMPLE_ID=MMETSP1356 /ASSEMBLY_ACC=CAM_ASM_000847 /LENGTH=411 /DNA_ID=CAMNT_0014334835 /DNA_START=26 /DNA_END=1261 /DNA_ORIENTATION=-
MSSYSHGAVYNPVGAAKPIKEPGPCCPRVFISPPHYIQGPSVIESLGRYCSQILYAKKVGILIPEFLQGIYGDVIAKSLSEAGVTGKTEMFGGIPSRQEIARLSSAWKSEGLDAVVSVGGGSCADAGKGVAFDLKVHMVVVSTQSATDAPCSALSIIYTAEGAYEGGQVYPQSPNIVVVDTNIVASAPKRSLISGFGDALSTYYEARTCWENPKALSMCEARPTATGYAIGEKSAQMLYEHAELSLKAVDAKTPDESLEMAVEANTLLSGIGFESGGLAASHAVAQALSWVHSVHDKHLHGEMVSFGLLTMLCMEETAGLKGRTEELQKVGEFLQRVGLPITFEQIHFDAADTKSMDTFIKVALEQWFCHNEPFKVDAEIIKAAFFKADAFGKGLVAKHGDAPYKAIHERK